MSPTTAMLWPMIGHVVLVFGLYMLLSLRRKAAVDAGEMTMDQFRENTGETLPSRLVNSNIANQFQIPVLFHIICILLYMTDAGNLFTIVLAWIFVASRYAHSYFQVTTNRLIYRSPAFALGFVAVAGLWAWLAFRLAFE